MKKINRALLVGFACTALFPISVLAAPGVTTEDIEQAKTFTLSQTEQAGFLSIANGRNCAVAGAGRQSGQGVLSPCPAQPKTPAEITKSLYIQLEEGMCLSDTGDSLELAVCSFTDDRQRWTTGLKAGTEVKNLSTRKCLTANGLNKPLTTKSCSGVPGQYWKLP